MKFVKNRLAVTIIVLSVSFLVLIGYSVKRQNPSLMENGVGVTFNSVQGIIYRGISGVKNWTGFITHFSEVKQENEDLKKKNIQMQQKVAAYDSLEAENKRLRNMSDFKDQHSQYNYVACNIIAKGANSLLDTYIIDKGKNDGVKNGLVVITPEGLVGKVIFTGNSWSQVGGLNNPNVQVAAKIQNTGDTNGFVKGYINSYNEKLAMIDSLLMDTDIKNGYEIVTSGVGNMYPKDIPIGKVTSVADDKTKISKYAIIKPYVDFNKLEEVFIVEPKNTDEIKY
ncbi:cell shape-determining protein MreC [Clostridium pasteurianum DSM 525 = ATCC 6013]|uniref:Cell shape-determining protein MreC n=1 Tax=Clostridium pasteurianum DSM 525 = ATCC 6013 TaxID=1262449 RepID=A0A0H3JAC0_CLOPA|nr:rod shape-determining protein MreC [Clostridium pasteurianum]AJA48430.1 cell shape-determining protein MreC [Clostridium pasteurianum DSM 525 = ATCC 6013]AJA52418.1 cell shape-determining protein MreC [Clostridium pasteurianum DSM 525 = ATCC 6013]AOZ75674.1 rod shape-determining protein MreC [Clostridium pasteurianum DSM 525 = ATCC 6013]AOZ79470.1 rod shape-determining protein MreC [Clostridium pasteurianum]ELP60420.1 rod shape-determining protein MreC [Clostridium pasteurianum DSM 525 = AT